MEFKLSGQREGSENSEEKLQSESGVCCSVELVAEKKRVYGKENGVLTWCLLDIH